jgi:hypothetical protein
MAGPAASGHGVTPNFVLHGGDAGAVSAASRAICSAVNEGTWPWRCAVLLFIVTRNRASVEIGRSRDSHLYAKLDVRGGRLGLRLDVDQVVDDAHARELTDCALGGVSLHGGMKRPSRTCAATESGTSALPAYPSRTRALLSVLKTYDGEGGYD